MSAAPARRPVTKSKKRSSSLNARRLSLAGYEITQICISTAFLEIQLGDAHSGLIVCFSSPFSMRKSNQEQLMDPKDPSSLTPLLSLVNQPAKHLDILPSGALKLTMADGRTIGAENESDIGSWSTCGLDELIEDKPRRRATKTSSTHS